jgi:type I restriction enzyme, S subunit
MSRKMKLGDALVEIKKGIGESWAAYPVYGATVDGLAPAKEPPGKNPERYKPAFPGTIFYNPMRILIGSVAYVDDNDPPGVTSPDYVVFKGKQGIVDSRWFYYWLRSPVGHECVLSLARGAVRERMLFGRLAEAKVTLPEFEVQEKYAGLLASAQQQTDTIKAEIEKQLVQLKQLPHSIVAASLKATQ